MAKIDPRTLRRPTRAVKKFEFALPDRDDKLVLKLRQLGALDGANLESFSQEERVKLDGITHDDEPVVLTADTSRLVTALLLAQVVDDPSELYTSEELALFMACSDSIVDGFSEAANWVISGLEAEVDGDSPPATTPAGSPSSTPV